MRHLVLAAAAVAVVVGSDTAVVVGVDSATVVSVVAVVPELWALTELRGRTVNAAMAPPVVTAVPRAATNALFLMRARFGPGHWTGLGVSSDRPPNSYGHRRAG